jgi:hypothetical protein
VNAMAALLIVQMSSCGRKAPAGVPPRAHTGNVSLGYIDC